LAKERKSLEKDTSAYTPAVSLIIGLDAVFDLIESTGGLKEVYRRHAILAEATREGARALGLRLLAPDSPSPAVTGVWLPEGIEGGAFTKLLRDVFGVQVAGGQGHLKGKIIRIGHIGYADAFDVVVAMSALEMALRKSGVEVRAGAGTSAAQDVLMRLYNGA